ncbi:MAG TPA: hypothetical protein DCM28_15300 [Phycisphaerales bacterium]|nr:hypothetical protein [Phycisphaerales bacterium]|tara:strand:+ start:160202 stop:164089 length:3888 start_codon:yes stop_codon:yes gene_type:complete
MKFIRQLFVWPFIATILLIGVSLGAQPMQNLLPDGDFENHHKGRLHAWISHVEKPGKATYLYNEPSDANDHAAVKLQQAGSDQDRWFLPNAYSIKVQPGQHYQLQVMAQTQGFDSDDNVRVAIVWLDQNRKTINAVHGKRITDNHDAAAVTVVAKAPDHATWVRPMLILSNGKNNTMPSGGSVIFDNATLYPVPAPKPRKSKPQPQAFKPAALTPIAQHQLDELWQMPDVQSPALWSAFPASVTLTGDGNILEKQANLMSIQYEDVKKKSCTLTFDKPILLPQNTWRLRSFVYGLTPQMQIHFCLEDQQGRKFIIKAMRSRPTRLTEEAQSQWPRWDQLVSLNLMQPTTEQIRDRITPEFKDSFQTAAWQTPYRLTGIQIDSTKPSGQPRQLIFASFGIQNQDGLEVDDSWLLYERYRFGYDNPLVIYPDDFAHQDGQYAVHAQISKGYQGPTVWEHHGQIKINTQTPVQLLQDAIRVGRFETGLYFLTLKTWQNNQLVAEQRFRYNVHRSSQPQNQLIQSDSWAWQTGMPHHVFPTGTQQAKLILTGKPHAFESQKSTDLKVKIQLTNWKRQVLVERLLNWKPDLELTLPVNPTDYYITADLLDGDVIRDRTRLHFGVAWDQTSEVDFVMPNKLYDPTSPSRDVHTTAEYNRPWYSQRHVTWPDTPWVDREHLTYFDNWLNDHVIKRGIGNISQMLCWADTEVLPGVFRWDELDRRNKLAADAGMDIIAWVGVLGNWPPERPDWWDGDLRLNQFGHPFGIGLGRISMRNPDASAWYAQRKDYLHWLDAAVRHVRHNPSVTEYKLMISGFMEATAKPEMEHTTTEYSQTYQNQYNHWLKAQGKSPRKLPKPIAIPSQSLELAGPDLSEDWMNFVRFKIHTANERLLDSMATIRKLDKVRPISIYRSARNGAPEMAIPQLAQNKAYFFDESGPNYFSTALMSMCNQGGIRYLYENHFYMPSSLEIIDSDIFYGSIFNQGWNYSYRWHERHRGEDTRYYQALDAMVDWLPTIKQYNLAQSDDPEVLVFGSRIDGMTNGIKHNFFANISGMNVYAGLFAYFQTPAHFANEFTPWVEFEKFKLVFVAGEVMTRDAMQRVVDYAKQGGRIVIVGNAGRYCVQEPGSRDLLIKMLHNLPGQTNIKYLPQASMQAPSPGCAPEAEFSTDRKQTLSILDWANIKRPLLAVDGQGNLDTGFECMLRRENEDTVYAGVYRRYVRLPKSRWYEQIMHIDANRQRWGEKHTTVQLSDLPAGQYELSQIHRNNQSLGIHTVGQDGILRWQTNTSVTGQLQIYKVTKTQ